MDKFKLVVFGSDWDVYQVAFRDLIDNPHIYYIPTFRPKGLRGFLQRIQFNPRLNSIFPMPFKDFWNSYYINEVDKTHPLCFLILENWLRLETGIRLLPYIKHRYPTSVIVCFAQDLLETIVDQYSNAPIDVEYIKNYTDLFISYDPADASKYNIAFHPTVYSPVNLNCGVRKIRYDLFFLGRDKGRLDKLVAICEEARRRNLICKFILLDVPNERRIESEGITYIDKELSYNESLQCCLESRCIVEILQDKAFSPTFRVWEAIAMNRRLLTNNVSLKDTNVYDERYISFFHDVTDINWSFVKSENAFSATGNPYQETIKPERLVEYIEQELNIQIDK
jgi:hypothetical protein